MLVGSPRLACFRCASEDWATSATRFSIKRDLSHSSNRVDSANLVTMASANIIVAKASFAAALLRPDPTSINREETSRFQKILDDTVLQCTPANIQV